MIYVFEFTERDEAKRAAHVPPGDAMDTLSKFLADVLARALGADRPETVARLEAAVTAAFDAGAKALAAYAALQAEQRAEKRSPTPTAGSVAAPVASHAPRSVPRPVAPGPVIE